MNYNIIQNICKAGITYRELKLIEFFVAEIKLGTTA